MKEICEGFGFAAYLVTANLGYVYSVAQLALTAKSL